LISLCSNASKVNLKHVKRVLIDFDPFDERTKSNCTELNNTPVLTDISEEATGQVEPDLELQEPVDYRKKKFGEILSKFGFKFVAEDPQVNPNDFNEIDEDQSVFICNLEEYLTKPQNEFVKEEFLDSLRFIYSEMNNNQLKICCSSTLSSVNCISSRGPSQDSLIKILLNCTITQSILLEELFKHMDSLLTKLTNRIKGLSLSLKHDTLLKHILNTLFLLSDPNDVQIASLLLSQLRSIELIENPSNFLNKLLNSLEKASTDIQIELIAVIPNFVVTFDGIEKLLLQRFLDILGDPKLRNAVLEAISPLSPNEEQVQYFIEILY